MAGVEVEIQFQNVYAWFPKKSQIPAFCMSLDKLTYVLFFHPALASHTR